MAAAERAAYAATPAELLDRGPAFIRLRSGLLRARLRGSAWDECEAFATAAHAFWLAVGERRTEAAAALAALRPTESESALALASPSPAAIWATPAPRSFCPSPTRAHDPARAAWLRAEAALDLCDRRRGPEARVLIERAKAQAAELRPAGPRPGCAAATPPASSSASATGPPPRPSSPRWPALEPKGLAARCLVPPPARRPRRAARRKRGHRPLCGPIR